MLPPFLAAIDPRSQVILFPLTVALPRVLVMGETAIGRSSTRTTEAAEMAPLLV